MINGLSEEIVCVCFFFPPPVNLFSSSDLVVIVQKEINVVQIFLLIGLNEAF